MMKLSLLAGLVLLMSTGPASAAGYPEPSPGDFIMKDFRFRSGEILPELRIHYRTIGTPQRDGTGRCEQRRLDSARDRRQRGIVTHGPLRGRAVRTGTAPGRGPLFHHPAGRDRARELEQAERRPARALSPLHLRRHGGGAVPSSDRKTRGEPPSPGARNFDGRNAYLALGGAAPRFHGCPDASRLPPGRDRRPQPHAETHDHGFHSRRSRMEERRV